MYTTLNKIRSCHPCGRGWAFLLRGLKKEEADDEPLHLLEILRISGAEDALWALRTLTFKECQLFAIGAARQTQFLWKSAKGALDAAEAYVLTVPLHGETVTVKALEKLREETESEEAQAAITSVLWRPDCDRAACVAARRTATSLVGSEAALQNGEMWAEIEMYSLLPDLIKSACAYVESRNG